MIDLEICKAYIHAKEIETCSRKIEYFSYHMARCTKSEDKIKLLVMILVQVAYSTINVSGVIESSEQIKNEIFKL